MFKLGFDGLDVQGFQFETAAETLALFRKVWVNIVPWALIYVLVLLPASFLAVPIDEFFLFEENALLIIQIKNIFDVICNVYVFDIFDFELFLEVLFDFGGNAINGVITVFAEFGAETDDAEI